MYVFGRCKWFDSKKGFGFIIVVNGEAASSEVFVHNSNIKPIVSTRRFLHQGEYVSLKVSDDGSGRLEAKDVTGVMGGPLMCDHPRRTRRGKNAEVQVDGGDLAAPEESES
nr:cold-shock protein [Oceanusvirus sp.]